MSNMDLLKKDLKGLFKKKIKGGTFIIFIKNNILLKFTKHKKDSSLNHINIKPDSYLLQT